MTSLGWGGVLVPIRVGAVATGWNEKESQLLPLSSYDCALNWLWNASFSLLPYFKNMCIPLYCTGKCYRFLVVFSYWYTHSASCCSSCCLATVKTP